MSAVPSSILYRYERVDQINKTITVLGLIHDIAKNEGLQVIIDGMKTMVQNILDRNLDPDDETVLLIEKNANTFIACYR